MAAFLYYIPHGSTGIKFEELQMLGLGYAFGKELNRRDIKGGPDRGDGVLFSDGERMPSELLGYFGDRQTWRKIAGLSKDAWVGFYDDQRPAPEDLLRPDPLPGHAIELMDGRKWQIPMAVEATDRDGGSTLIQQTSRHARRE